MEHSNIARELSFPSLRSKGPYKDLLDVLDLMIVVTHAVDNYHQGHHPMPALLDIIRARNAVQHRLLSLISPSFATPVELATFTTCRLAAMIYSEMVLFPMPLIAGVKPRLAYMLRKALGSDVQIPETSSMTQLRLWMVIFGAIAAKGTENRLWYIERLSSLMTVIDSKEYSDFVRTMKRYLWWDYACQEPALAAWSEALAIEENNEERVVLPAYIK